MKLYLAYGANTNLRSMSARCPAAKYVCNLTLNHHQLVFRGVADVVAARGRKVECALWLITPECEASLDGFEGFPNLYVKKYVRVWLNERWTRVMFYVMRRARSQQLPSKSYEDTLRGGYADCGINPVQIDRAIERVHAWERANPRPVAPVYKGSWTKSDAASVTPIGNAHSYTQGWLPLPIHTGRGGRIETQAEKERREEQQADEFYRSLYAARGKGIN